MMALTLDIAARTLFSVDIARHSGRIGKALTTVMEVSASPQRILKAMRVLGWRKERRYRRGVAELDEIVYGIIRERRATQHAGGSEHGDLLGMLLEARDENGNGMSDQQLRDETLTLLLAGHETTAIALSWTWYLLSQNPDVARKLDEELDAVLGGREPAVEDLPRLPYTERVIKESLRLYPPAYVILRLAVEDAQIGGYVIPRGSSAGASPWVTQRSAKFFPEPLRFYPDRWTEEFSRQLPRFAYFPFGGGPRICIGAQFALMEAALVLATIAQRWELQSGTRASRRAIPIHYAAAKEWHPHDAGTPLIPFRLCPDLRASRGRYASFHKIAQKIVAWKKKTGHPVWPSARQYRPIRVFC